MSTQFAPPDDATPPQPWLRYRGKVAVIEATGIVDGTGIGEALGNTLGGGPVITQIFVILMIMALFMAIMTAMAGSSPKPFHPSFTPLLPVPVHNIYRCLRLGIDDGQHARTAFGQPRPG